MKERQYHLVYEALQHTLSNFNEMKTKVFIMGEVIINLTRKIGRDITAYK